MPVQTSNTAYIKFPDGAKVSIKAAGDASYTDLGAINSSITNTLNYTENQITTANAGKTIKQIRDMNIDGAFTLINLNYDNIEKLGGGLFTKVTTPASANSSIPNQVIAAGWAENTFYPLEMQTSPTDSTLLNMGTTKPTLTSVTLDAAGTPETLTEGTDYVVVKGDAVSKWGLVFQVAGIAKPSPTTYAITIDYGTNTPVARVTLNAGSSTALLSAYSLKIEHTDSAGLIRGIELFSVDTKSGGFAFNFRGANEDGLEELPVSYMAQLDTSLTDGAQLISIYADNGAA